MDEFCTAFCKVAYDKAGVAMGAEVPAGDVAALKNYFGQVGEMLKAASSAPTALDFSSLLPILLMVAKVFLPAGPILDLIITVLSALVNIL